MAGALYVRSRHSPTCRAALQRISAVANPAHALGAATTLRSEAVARWGIGGAARRGDRRAHDLARCGRGLREWRLLGLPKITDLWQTPLVQSAEARMILQPLGGCRGPHFVHPVLRFWQL